MTKKASLLQELKIDAKRIDDKALLMCCFIFGAVAWVMCLVNIMSEAGHMAMITAGIGLWVTINAVIFLIGKKKLQIVIGLLVCAYVVMMYFLMSGGEQGFSIVWLLLVPPAATYFFGLYYGGVLSLCLGISTIIYMWTPLHKVGYEYSTT
ncbi:MAG: hypothetical protein IJF07_08465, partial [Lachnospiraceae bacterium]|nr:hypothetical protein [Lachnospiraceae bacterium]